MKRIVVFLLLNCWFLTLNAQGKDSIIVRFQVKFGKELLQLQHHYVSGQKDTLSISTFKCYISGIKLVYADGTSTANKDYHLLDIENAATLQFNVGGNSSKPISKITFNVGVDSLASVSGALSGDLDPTKGMYWAWQSGYINMKVEGKSHSCKTHKNEFQFHIGGYLKPHNALRTVEIKTTKPEIIIDLASLFEKIPLSQTNSIMIPGQKAMEIANQAVQMFRAE